VPVSLFSLHKTGLKTYEEHLSREARRRLIECEFHQFKRRHDIHDYSSDGEGTYKKKESATRRSIFRINKERSIKELVVESERSRSCS